MIDDATLLWTLREKIGLKKVPSLVTWPACVEPAPFMWMGNQSAYARLGAVASVVVIAIEGLEGSLSASPGLFPCNHRYFLGLKLPIHS